MKKLSVVQKCRRNNNEYAFAEDLVIFAQNEINLQLKPEILTALQDKKIKINVEKPK